MESFRIKRIHMLPQKMLIHGVAPSNLTESEKNKNKTGNIFCLQLNKVSKDLPRRPYSEIVFPETSSSGVWIQTPYFSNYWLFSYPLFCVGLSNTIPAKYNEVCCCKKTKFKSYGYICEALGRINHHPSDALFWQSPGLTGKSSMNCAVFSHFTFFFVQPFIISVCKTK